LPKADFDKEVAQPWRRSARLAGWGRFGDAFETEVFDEQNGDDIKGKVANHGPVVGHACGIDESGTEEPGFVLVVAEFEEATNDVSEDQEVEHFAGERGGVFPEGELEGANGNGDAGRGPRCETKVKWVK
jgi:hypothetical protein